MEKIILYKKRRIDDFNKGVNLNESIKLFQSLEILVEHLLPNESIAPVTTNDSNIKSLIKDIKKGRQLTIYFTESINLIRKESLYDELIETMIIYDIPFYLSTSDINEVRHFNKKVDKDGLRVFNETLSI